MVGRGDEDGAGGGDGGGAAGGGSERLLSGHSQGLCGRVGSEGWRMMVVVLRDFLASGGLTRYMAK